MPLDDVCTVWLARVPATDDRLANLLDQAERWRLGRLRDERDRHRFVAAAALLRLVLAERTGSAPAAVAIDRACPHCGRPHGRPRLRDSPRDVDVSVSHAGSFVAVALVVGGRVGIDVEVIPESHEELIEPACSPRERPNISSARDFAVVWVRKEAVAKADGVGLRASPAEIVVSAPADPAALMSFRGKAGVDCQLWDVPVDDRHVGATAVLAPMPRRLEVVDASLMLEAGSVGPERQRSNRVGQHL